MDQQKLFEAAIAKCASCREEVNAFLALGEKKKAEELRLNGKKIFSAFTHIYDCLGFGTKKVYAPCTELWHEIRNSTSVTVKEIVRKVTTGFSAET